MRTVLWPLALIAVLHVTAQYDVGVSLGSYFSDMYVRDTRGTFDNAPGGLIPYTLTAWYRESGERMAGLGFEVQWTHRSFHAEYYTGGLGGGTTRNYEVQADFLHVSLYPTVRLDRNGRIRFLMGPQFGTLLSSNGSGSNYSWSMYGPTSEGTIDGSDARKWYVGDFRWLVGLSWWSSLGARYGISLDPYISFGMTPMHEHPISMKSTDAGLRVSVGFRIPRRTLWESFRAGAPNG